MNRFGKSAEISSASSKRNGHHDRSTTPPLETLLRARAESPRLTTPVSMPSLRRALVIASACALALVAFSCVAVVRSPRELVDAATSVQTRRRALLGGVALSRDPDGGYTGGAFNLTIGAPNTTFTRKLLAEARAVDASFVGDGDVLSLDAAESLCATPFFRGRRANPEFALNLTELDEAYALAHPLHSNGILPVGCMHGCIIGGGILETIARVYGVTRTLTPSSWRGKCFQDALAPVVVRNNATNDRRGLVVTNRIKVNYGPFLNQLFGLDEPLQLYPGKAYAGESLFAPGEDALVVDYGDHAHEFAPFRDEIREVYPGMYVGKMYALPGASLWNGALVVPDGDPLFAINFVLFAEPGAAVLAAPREETP